MLSAGAVALAVEAQFPKVKVSLVLPEGFSEETCIRGLVLRNIQGEGALQEACVPAREVISNVCGWSLIQ